MPNSTKGSDFENPLKQSGIRDESWVKHLPKHCADNAQDMSPATGLIPPKFYWEHADGRKSLRISYHKESREFFGIVSLGIRLRQDFFNVILDEHHSVDTVIKNLKQANFDPEFYDRYDRSIVAAFNRNHQQQQAQV